jgi:hypothetical protein
MDSYNVQPVLSIHNLHSIHWTLVKAKAKVMFSLYKVMKTWMGSRGIALLFPQPQRYKGVDGQRHGPVALLPGKTQYPLYRRLGGLQGRYGRVRKISPPPTEIRYPDIGL